MIIAKIKSSFNRYSLLLIAKTQLFFAHIAHLNETVYKTVKTRNQSLLLTKPRSDFEIWININPTTVIKDGRISSAGIMIHLKRDGLGLLMGSSLLLLLRMNNASITCGRASLIHGVESCAIVLEYVSK